MISQKQYVARLEKMLKVDEPCGTCPTNSYKGWFDCDVCRDFIDIDSLNVWDGWDGCPCYLFKRPHTALKRAGKAIIAYKAGTHKWQKEDKP